MRQVGALVLAAVCLARPLAAQRADVAAAVDRYVREDMRRQRIPGVSVAVLRGDSVVLMRGWEQSNVELHALATDSTVYQSGSLGKQFTAALVVQLARAGKLGLDVPIRRYFPDGPPSWDSITVRHLLTHTSGIPDYTDSLVDLRRDYTEGELVQLAAGLPLQFRPGDHWRYSNTGYVLLGAIIRRVTGTFYGDLLRRQIFVPLGMRTARVISEADIVPNRAAGYRLSGDTLLNQEWVAPALNTTADGSLYLTVRDLARWVIGWDGGRVLDRRERDAAWTPVRLNDGTTYPYGFGWELNELRATRRIGHTGSWQGFKTALERFPASGLTVIVLANLGDAHPEAMALGIAGLFDSALVPPHRMVAPLAAARPPVPLDWVLARLSDGTDSALTTPGLKRFLGQAERRDWREALGGIARWTALGCEPPRDHPIERFGAPVAWICYTRGEHARDQGGLGVSVLWTEDWRVADAEGYEY
ncbi:MAG: serine hydrolase domain-containing protein [Gemmatimonadales bacterium]